MIRAGCVEGTCNGLVCLAGATEDITIIIWNPTVRKFVILPRPVDIFNYDENPRQTHHALGHDQRNNDYKVLRIVSDRKEEPAVRVEVYSLLGDRGEVCLLLQCLLVSSLQMNLVISSMVLRIGFKKPVRELESEE